MKYIVIQLKRLIPLLLNKMTIEEFVLKAKEQDSRNIFEPYTGNVSFVPIDIRKLYVIANPIDVEIRTRKYGNIYFFPLDHIRHQNREYSFMPEDAFIFASTNGDPIFIKDSQFFISYESEYIPEKISDSFSRFLDIIKMF